MIEGLEFYYDAFRELGTARQFGMGIGPIPFTAIADYFRVYSIDGDFDEFSHIIRCMDNVYLQLNADDMTAKNNKGNKSGNSDSNKTNSNQG